MAMSGGSDDGEPMMEMNTTPLIDVMLVLLIMFIITIPPQTNAVKVPLPVPDPANQTQVDPVKNRLYIDEVSTIYWNGQPINQGLMETYLTQTQQMDPKPLLEFEPNAQAPYSTVDQVLAAIDQIGVQNLGFVGNEQYRNFAKAARPADAVDQ